MNSNKLRRRQINIRRAEHRRQSQEAARHLKREKVPASERVNASALAPNNSYGIPLFVQRGYYVDETFTCKECGKEEVWTASQQKWWFEVAKGYVESRAVRCATCRRKNRDHRLRSLQGMKKKLRVKKRGEA